jgi:hypothetical protein
MLQGLLQHDEQFACCLAHAQTFDLSLYCLLQMLLSSG